MRYDQLLQRQATTEWLLEHERYFTHAVTLTFKPYTTVMTERGQCNEQLTQEKATQNVRHFINRVNAELYGQNARRNGYSITLVGALEGEATGKHLHYHCAVGNLPANLSAAETYKKIASAWHLTRFGNEQVHVQAMTTTGWLGYISKDVGRMDTDVIDWENVRLQITA